MSKTHKSKNKNNKGVFEYYIPPCCSNPLNRVINPVRGKIMCLKCGSEIEWMN